MKLLACLLLVFIASVYSQSFEPNATVVSGSGLTEGVAGDPTYFTLQLKNDDGSNYGSCAPQTSFTYDLSYGGSAIATQAVCSLGLITVTYTPRKSGIYTLNIEYEDSVVIGDSPYSPNISPGTIFPPSSSAAGQLDGTVVGVIYNFTITAFDRYDNLVPSCSADWSIQLTGASSVLGSVYSCNETLGEYYAHYSANIEGGYSMTVGINSLYLPDSPFKFDLAASSLYPQKCVASGSGATSATAGLVSIFKVTAVDQYGNRVTSCTALSDWSGYLELDSQQTSANVTSCSNGIYSWHYTVTKASNYKLYVFYKGIGIASNGQTVEVTASTVISGTNSIASGAGLTDAIAGTPAPVSIQPYDQYNNKITSCPSSSSQYQLSLESKTGSDTCVGEVVKCETSTGLVSAQYTCFIATAYTFSISFQGSAISNSPFSPTVVPGPLSGPESITSGTGISKAFAGSPAYFKIDAVDQYSNNITTCLSDYSSFQIKVEAIEGGSTISGTVHSCASGTYNCSYTITKIQAYRLRVLYNGVNVASSPYSIESFPGPPSQCNTVGEGLTSGIAGEYADFNTSCSDQYGNTITTCLSDSYWSVDLTGASVSASVTGSVLGCVLSKSGGAATTKFHYNATVAGIYNLKLGFSGEGTSSTIKTSTPVISASTVDPSHTTAYGPGVSETKSLTVGTNTSVYIFTQDRFGNNITSCAGVSSSDFSFTFSTQKPTYSATYDSCNNGQVTFKYGTLKSGQYVISISYKGIAIVNGPFTVTWLSGGLYGPSITASGSGLFSGVAGVAAPIVLQGRDQYNNTVDSCSTSFTDFELFLTGEANVKGAVWSCSSGIYNANYTAIYAGQYSLQITFQNVNISGVPFSPVISASTPVDSKATATGTGVMNGSTFKAGESVTVIITTHDQYGNPTTNCLSSSTKKDKKNKKSVLSSSTYFQVTASTGNVTKTVLTTTDCSNGVYSGTYTITKTGTYTITVSGQSTKISGTPTTVTVLPGDFYPANAVSSTFDNEPIGKTVVFTIQSYDVYGNKLASCPSFNASNWYVHLEPQTSGSVSFTGSVNSCSGAGLYSAQVLSNNASRYRVDIDYESTAISNSGFLTTFIYGEVSAKYTRAYGPGVSNATTNIAGTNTHFDIQTYNQYGAAIHGSSGCASSTEWIITITPEYNPYQPNGTLSLLGCALGIWSLQYNSTVAGYLTVSIELNNTAIYQNPYQARIYPAELDINKTELVLNSTTGFFPDNGTFFLQTQDKYGNDLTSVSDDFQVALSPFCANTTVMPTGNVVGGLIEFEYRVQQGGQYCVIVYYNNLTIEVQSDTATTLLITGGQGCSDLSHCNDQGYCFTSDPVNSTSSFECSCFQGWVGDDCSVDFDSEYPLTLGPWIGIVVGLAILMLVVGIVIGCCCFKFLKRGDENQSLLA